MVEAGAQFPTKGKTFQHNYPQKLARTINAMTAWILVFQILDPRHEGPATPAPRSSRQFKPNQTKQREIKDKLAKFLRAISKPQATRNPSYIHTAVWLILKALDSARD